MNETKYPSVSTTLTIGGVELPNRIVFPAWQVNYANTDEAVSDKPHELLHGDRRRWLLYGLQKMGGNTWDP